MTEVEGVRETLRTLKETQPKLVTATRKRMREAVSPLQSKVRSRLVPSPMSGWTSGRYAYSQSAASGGVKVQISTGRASARKSSWPLVTLRQTNAGGAVFDIAGRRSGGNSPQGRQFIRNLNRYGQASRSMWAAVEDHGGIDDIQRSVTAAISDAEKALNAELK